MKTAGNLAKITSTIKFNRFQNIFFSVLTVLDFIKIDDMNDDIYVKKLK